MSMPRFRVAAPSFTDAAGDIVSPDITTDFADPTIMADFTRHDAAAMSRLKRAMARAVIGGHAFTFRGPRGLTMTRGALGRSHGRAS